MIRRQKTESWDALAERLTEVYWRGSIGPAESILNSMLAALSECIHYGEIDESLIAGLYRVCDFFCLENRFADADKLYQIVLHAQNKLKASDEHTIDTVARMERLRYVWEISVKEKAYSSLKPCRPINEKLRKAS